MRRNYLLILLLILSLSFTAWSGSEDSDTVITRIEAPVVTDSGKFSFILFGDTRTSSTEDLMQPDNKAYKNIRNRVFNAVTATLKKKDASFTLFTGDMIWRGGDNSYWKEAESVLTPYTMKKIYPIMGNHELWDVNKEGEGLRNFGNAFPHLKTRDGKVLHNYWFMIGDNLFINLCTGKYGKNYSKENAYKWDKEWTCTVANFPQVKKAMVKIISSFAKEKKRGNVFVQYHKPSFSYYKHPPLDSVNDPAVVLSNLKKEYAQLDMYVFNGHNHTTEIYNYNAVKVIVAGGGGAPAKQKYTPYPAPYKPVKELFWAALGIDKTKRPRRANYFTVDIDMKRKTPVLIVEKCLGKMKKDGLIRFCNGCSIVKGEIKPNPERQKYDANLDNFIKDF